MQMHNPNPLIRIKGPKGLSVSLASDERAVSTIEERAVSAIGRSVVSRIGTSPASTIGTLLWSCSYL
jgi:hypothetical protein